jgi:hypothetical protein
MMATGLVLRVVPLLFPCCAGTRRGQARCRAAGSPAVRGQAPRWSNEKMRSESATPSPFFPLSQAQVKAFETWPTPG